MTADRIAEKTGVAKDAPERICGGIIYVLELATMQGHTYLPRRLLLQETERILGIDRKIISENILELESMNHVYIEKIPGKTQDEDAIYHPLLYSAEKYAAMNLSLMNKADKKHCLCRCGWGYRVDGRQVSHRIIRPAERGCQMCGL